MAKNLEISKFSEELMYSISYIQRLARTRLKRRSDALIQGAVTMPQYLSLELLNTKGQLKMKEIAKFMYISLPAASGLIDRLVGLKFVIRTYNKKDRRVILIELTPGGKKVAEKTKEARKKIIEDIFGSLTDAERMTYLRIIRKVKRSLHEKSGKD